ncbi:MAG TPA: glycosyltransferase family 1 protein [Candidatus Baltobacteraceae bacterium]|nr:glycosyltransferase family 1 protein [Candidatus Baltobacteraceae bacterium]
MKLGVDAINLAADRRGMGRVVRKTLEDLQRLGVTPTLIVRNARDAEALETIETTQLPVVTAGSLWRRRLDRVWYPWNGMRFSPHAYSIATVHDPFAFTYPHHEFVARWREQAPIKRAIARADRLTAVSAWTANEIVRLFPRAADRIEVVPNAVGEFWKPVERREQEPYFFFLAGRESRKNTAMLFHAYEAAFAGGGPRLFVTGSLWEGDEAILNAMKAPHARIDADDAQLRRLYGGALAVLVPSLAEGFGLPALEAMACGAPVVAANTTALPETCGGAALLADPGDVDAWTKALQRLAADRPLREDLRARGLLRAADARHDRLAQALLR